MKLMILFWYDFDFGLNIVFDFDLIINKTLDEPEMAFQSFQYFDPNRIWILLKIT